jgi:hypothetical protein
MRQWGLVKGALFFGRVDVRSSRFLPSDALSVRILLHDGMTYAQKAIPLLGNARQTSTTIEPSGGQELA